jgi:hypothetical protein
MLRVNVIVSMAPIQVKITVSYQVNPRPNPVIGPAINFNPVAIITPE